MSRARSKEKRIREMARRHAAKNAMALLPPPAKGPPMYRRRILVMQNRKRGILEVRYYGALAATTLSEYGDGTSLTVRA